MVAYSINIIEGEVVSYSSVKFDPCYVREYSGYALFYKMSDYYLADKKFTYINDGARCISHDTNIQEHLIKKHGFRKAYCHLHVLYHPIVILGVLILFPFRSLFGGGKVKSVLIQEGIRRTFKI